MLNKKNSSPIITSLLDSDFYKFTMGYLIFKKYKDNPVTYKLTDRKNIQLPKIINIQRLKEELDFVRTLKITKSELHYLRGTNEYKDRMFSEDYLEFLSKLQLPPYDLKIIDNTFILEFSGKWSETIYWETIALSIINELYYESIMNNYTPLERDCVISTGIMRLLEKINKLPLDSTFADFGTRRRFSKKWQWYVLENIRNLPQFIGTSNTRAAMEFDCLPIGTSAHEMYLGVSGICRTGDINRDRSLIKESHGKTLLDWRDTYHYGLSIALTDTYGTDFFFKDFNRSEYYTGPLKWKGVRHDSGDPILFGEKTIKFYENIGIDPKTKLIVFSDELNINKIIELYERFNKRIKITFGWGTNLTNDLGFNNLSIVIKLSKSNGFGTVKLSDNPEKSMGDPNDIKLFREIFST